MPQSTLSFPLALADPLTPHSTRLPLAYSQIAEFVRRGWTDVEIEGLMGGNILRVMDEVQAIGTKLRAGGLAPSREIYEKRTDLPAFEWGGPNGAYLPADVKAVVDKKRVRDEL